MISDEMTGQRPAARAPAGAVPGAATTSAGGGADTGLSARIANARVDQRVETVHTEVDAGHDHCRDQDHGLDHREIAPGDGLEGEPAHPGPGKDRLHDDR